MFKSSSMLRRCLIALLLLASASIAIAQPEPQWVRVFGLDLNDYFNDLYVTAGGDYAMCGNKINGNSHDMWFLKADEDGELIVQRQYGDANSIEYAETIIELDNSDFLIGGFAADNRRSRFRVIRVNSDGDPIWGNFYGEPQGICYSVIELKDGNLLAAGFTCYRGDSLVRANDNGYLVKLNGRGDVIWEFQYGEGSNEYFFSMKEVDDGVILAGCTVTAAWLVKVDDDGDVVWERFFERFELQTQLTEMFTQIINCREGGWLAVGLLANLQGQANVSDYWAMRLSNQGEAIWERRYDIGTAGYARWFRCTVEAPNGDFLFVGQGPSVNGHGESIIFRADRDGTPSWHRMIGQEWGNYWTVQLNSVLFAPDGGVICAGWGGLPGGQAQGGGMLVKLPMERTQPLIIDQIPDTTELTILTGDTLMFDVVALDAQMDSLLYEWRRNDSLISTDTTIYLHFPEAGDETIGCHVSDGNEADSTAWLVHVRDLYITAYQPDTLQLNLRRGCAENFCIDVAAHVGAVVGYTWTLTDLGSFERNVVSAVDSVDLRLNRCGTYSLSAFASFGEANDQVIWTISVRSAIYEFYPTVEAITAPIDSSLDFEVIPFNPDSDSLTVRWLYDEHVIGDGFTANILFQQSGLHLVKVVLFDGGEGDSVEWQVDVEPESVSKEGGLPSEFDFSLAPNPFNGSTTIRISLPIHADTHISLFDLGGREVTVVSAGRLTAGEHVIPVALPNLPDGVYLVRLQAGSASMSKKCVMMR